jgi:uncharacterized protein (DUF58 family)
VIRLRWPAWPWRAASTRRARPTGQARLAPGAVATGGPAWHPAALDRLRRIHLLARVASRTLWLGHQRSRRTGDGQIFAAHVDYSPDHDARRIDWRAWGRNDRLVVKRYDTETRVPVWIVVDLSADVGTGGEPRPFDAADAVSPGPLGASALGETKGDRLSVLAATLALWVQRQGEPVGLWVLGGEEVDVPVRPPRPGPAHVAALVATLARCRPGGRAGLGDGLTALSRRRPGRSVVFVLSDAMEPVTSFAAPVASLSAQGVDLRWLQVADEAELDLVLPGGTQVYSPEGGGELPVDPVVAGPAFREEVARWREDVRRAVVGVGGAHLWLPVGESIERAALRIARDGVGAPVGARWEGANTSASGQRGRT